MHKTFICFYVASTGIEPVSGASETLILSIVLRGQSVNWKFKLISFNQSMCIGTKYFYRNSQQYYTKKFSHNY